MPASFTVDECRRFLHRAGWSAGETGGASAWLVTGSRGKTRIHAEGDTQGAAWWQACVQACAVACWRGRATAMDEATWLASTHFQRMYSHLKSGQGMATTKGGPPMCAPHGVEPCATDGALGTHRNGVWRAPGHEEDCTPWDDEEPTT